MITNADNVLFRPSSNGEIMSGVAKGWDVEKSVTCKRALIKMFREIKYKRYSQHGNKYTEKGIAQENEAITLLSRVHGIGYVKNDKRIKNDYFTGEPDIIRLPKTLDVKCSWSLDTFPSPLIDKVDDDYMYQGDGYMDLTGATSHTIAYCLVNGTPGLIDQEKKRLWYKLGCVPTDSEEYILGCVKIERNSIFEMALFNKRNPEYELQTKNWNHDIPFRDRVVEFTINRNEDRLASIKKRIADCRNWMNKNLFTIKPNA